MSRKIGGSKSVTYCQIRFTISQLVTRSCINRVILDGKRRTAASIVYGAFEANQRSYWKRAHSNPQTAMGNIMPVLEVRASCWWI